MTQTRRAFLIALAPTLAAAQTLAHPGWRGNGIATEQWWRHAAVVQLPPDCTFTTVTAALDTAAAAGADTLLLPDLEPPPNGTAPFAERFGSLDDLDALLREASARRMHVLLTAPLLRLANSSGEQRFWLARGIGGFRVGGLRPAYLDTLQVLRTGMDRAPGQRLLLVDFDTEDTPISSASFTRMFRGPTVRLGSLREAEANFGTTASVGAVLIPDPATAPALHGLLPVVPVAALQTEGSRVATQRLLAQSRMKQSGSPVRRRR